MHDTDANPSSPQSGKLHDEAAVSSLPPQKGKKLSSQAPDARGDGGKASLFRRVLHFFAALFTRRASKPIPAALSANVASRAATARAAQLPPPMAFKGDTANTIATPMGTYAGKPPVEQALRKRAEQQLKAMDVTRTTMH